MKTATNQEATMTYAKTIQNERPARVIEIVESNGTKWVRLYAMANLTNCVMVRYEDVTEWVER